LEHLWRGYEGADLFVTFAFFVGFVSKKQAAAAPTDAD
jgi:hypothetical protein